MHQTDTQIRISAGQFAPGENKEENLSAIARLVEQAAADGVRVLILPELSMYRRLDSSLQDAAAAAEPLTGPFVTEILKISAESGLLIAVGIYEQLPAEMNNSENVYNTLVIADRGELLHVYRKVHLYDAFTAKESDLIIPGDELAPVLEIDGFKIGFAICYDIRFPELFRTMADRGADIIAIATAWARGVGKEEHWDVLTRCRAIENTAYVVASGEVSSKSVGRSRILDPLGYSLGDAGEQLSALVTVNADKGRINEVRAILPSLQNRRLAVNHQVEPIGAMNG